MEGLEEVAEEGAFLEDAEAAPALALVAASTSPPTTTAEVPSPPSTPSLADAPASTVASASAMTASAAAASSASFASFAWARSRSSADFLLFDRFPDVFAALTTTAVRPPPPPPPSPAPSNEPSLDDNPILEPPVAAAVAVTPPARYLDDEAAEHTGRLGRFTPGPAGTTPTPRAAIVANIAPVPLDYCPGRSRAPVYLGCDTTREGDRGSKVCERRCGG